MTSKDPVSTTARKPSDSVSDEEIFSFPDESLHHRWTISWSDLMMTMFILFAVMYIYQVGDKEIRFGQGPGNGQISQEGGGRVILRDGLSLPLDIFDRTRQAVRDVMVDKNVKVDLVDSDTVKIILAADLLFDPGRADLKPGARYQLDQIATALQGSADMINVAGHTDNTPSRSDRYPTNWDLSAQRAVSVVRYLTESAGVPQERIFITAHAFHQPLESNDTAMNRSLNRRVEIILTRQKY